MQVQPRRWTCLPDDADMARTAASSSCRHALRRAVPLFACRARPCSRPENSTFCFDSLHLIQTQQPTARCLHALHRPSLKLQSLADVYSSRLFASPQPLHLFFSPSRCSASWARHALHVRLLRSQSSFDAYSSRRLDSPQELQVLVSLFRSMQLLQRP